MKLCQDCRHILRDKNSKNSSRVVGLGSCMHPKMDVTTTDYVTGALIVEHPSCQISRILGDCGKEGKFWERD